MAKPICIIYWPENFDSGGSGRRDWIYELMNALNGEETFRIKRMPFPDYYWFCFYKEGITEPEFQTFYEKDFDEIKFEELKKIVLDAAKKPQPIPSVNPDNDDMR